MNFTQETSITRCAYGQSTILRVQQFLLLFFSIVLVAFTGCSGALKMTSERRQSDIIIDGDDSEWQSGLYYDKESDIVYSVRNDDEYVYILLKTQNRSMQKQLVGSGFTIWFDAEGGKDPIFGVRYPLGRHDAKSEFHPDGAEEQNRNLYDQLFPELEILGPKKDDIQRFSILEAPGIRVRIGQAHEVMVYELQVPLKKTPNHPYAIEVTSKNLLGIKFETQEFKREGKKEGSYSDKGFTGNENTEGNSPGGEEHTGRGHGGGHRGGVSGSKEQPTQLDLWLSVQLTTAAK
jgi:hypothetical protein